MGISRFGEPPNQVGNKPENELQASGVGFTTSPSCVPSALSPKCSVHFIELDITVCHTRFDGSHITTPCASTSVEKQKLQALPCCRVPLIGCCTSSTFNTDVAKTMRHPTGHVGPALSRSLKKRKQWSPGATWAVRQRIFFFSEEILLSGV